MVLRRPSHLQVTTISGLVITISKQDITKITISNTAII